MESALMRFELANSQELGASLVVLGLPVLERNVRQLGKNGFAALPNGILKMQADVQFAAASFSEIRKIVVGNPNQSHQFQNAFGQLLPVEWDAGVESICNRHTVTWPVFAVTDLLAKQHATDVQKLLADALLAEIYASTQGWIARGLNKKISFRLTKHLLKIPITPNQITLANLFLGLLGCLCFLSPSYWLQCFGALLLQFNSIVDGCDGEVARLKVLSSKIGGWLDTVADDILNNAMFVCLIVGIYAENHNGYLFNFGLLSVVASVGVTAFIYQNLWQQKSHNAAHFKLSWEKTPSEVLPNQKSWFDVVKPLLKRDFFIFVVFIFVILNVRQWLMVFLLPIWGAFFLYLASFVHSLKKGRV